jgi:hypothetical protein
MSVPPAEDTRRTLFMVLGGVAIAALLTAILVWVLAVKGAGIWIVATLAVVILVIVAEVWLLILGREKRATPETYDFVIEAEVEESES